jgi:hypothetical protein
MQFLDCNCYFGLPYKPPASPAMCPTADDLVAALERAGIEQAIAWHIAQHDGSPQYGNALLAAALPGRKRLLGCWTVLPDQTGEMPVEELLSAMKTNGIVALRAFPVAHRYIFNRETMGRLLDAMTERRIPLIYSVRRVPAGSGGQVVWAEIHRLMAEFPKLTVIVTDHGSWGCDRYFRPLLEKYERFHIDTAIYFLDGGIEDVVARYGAARLIFGSGLPERYPGGMMLAVRHAEISEKDRALIAGGNLARLLKEVQL